MAAQAVPTPAEVRAAQRANREAACLQEYTSVLRPALIAALHELHEEPDEILRGSYVCDRHVDRDYVAWLQRQLAADFVDWEMTIMHDSGDKLVIKIAEIPVVYLTM